MKKIKNIYVHIPFCRRKCLYCDFPVYALGQRQNQDSQNSIVNTYLSNLKREIRYTYEKIAQPLELDTIYFGGGTPSLLEPDDFAEIIESVGAMKNDDAEISIELDPGTFDLAKLNQLKNYTPITRYSIGVQTFNENEFKMLGRPHEFGAIEQAIETVDQSKIGFENISLDLMIGIPLQSLESFKRNLEKLVSYEVGHCSLYMLQVEPGTPFYKMYDKNRDLLPSDDLVSEMYDHCQDFLGQHGLHQYEVSNFARVPKMQSKHNIMYWEGDQEYLAFGMGAASFFNGYRFSRPKTLKKYENWINELETGEWDFLFENGSFDKMKNDCEDLSVETQDKLLDTVVMCQLRKNKGLEIKKLEKYMSEQQIGMFLEELRKKGGKYIKIEDQYLRLDPSTGFIVSNEIISEILLILDTIMKN